ncbi:myeloperoxidase-like [Aplochiton taeniatus]
MNVVLWFLDVGLYLCLQSQVNADQLSRSFIKEAVNEAKAKVDHDYESSRKTSLALVGRNAASPAHILRLLKQPVGETRSAVRAADYMEHAIHLIREKRSRARHVAKRSLNSTDLITPEALMVIADLTGCASRVRLPSCQTIDNLDKFRTASSVCNNRKDTRRGSSNTPFARWLPAEYQDGISAPKGWDEKQKVNGFVLPLVREVSNRILRISNGAVEEDMEFTYLVTTFGQWNDHDLTFTPTSPSIISFNNGISCSESCERADPCFPIMTPVNGPRINQTKNECMHFFRSAPACGTSFTGFVFGNATERQQINSLTSFIDAGQVYGSDDAKARSLRDLTPDTGLLRVNSKYTDNGRELLPFATMKDNICATRAKATNVTNAEEVPCFKAGDERSDENPALTSLHTLMLREHNRLARELAKLNPTWDGERLYQEARKIVGAYFQVVTFRDYLLHIVGPDIVQKQLSTYPGYDENVDPSISNVFATAAFRFGHLTVQPFVFRLNDTYENHPLWPSPLLHKSFFSPWRIIFEGGVDPILRGLVGSRAKLNTRQARMTDELRDRLFEFEEKMALDLASLNMQRGRDHALPGYNKWRKFCGLSTPRNVAELSVVMNSTTLAKNLMALYKTPDNIDVWLGGVAEPFVPNGRVGPLFACIIATQFQRIRQGDKLWWENSGVFSRAQRRSLRKTSLARIICDNTGIADVPKRPFLFRARGSGYDKCTDIPSFNLAPWKKNREFKVSGIPRLTKRDYMVLFQLIMITDR